jgi:hypothetical protein
MFTNVKISERPIVTFKYTDVAAIISGIIPLLIGIIETVFLFPISGIMILLFYYKQDKIGLAIHKCLYSFTNLTIFIKIGIGWGLSLILGGIKRPLFRYRRNKMYIHCLYDPRLSITDWKHIPDVYRFEFTKSNLIYIWMKNIVMWTFNPICKYIVSDNPFLFDMVVSVTNHSTFTIPVADRHNAHFKVIESIFYDYVGNTSKNNIRDLKRLNGVNKLDDLTFTADYVSQNRNKNIPGIHFYEYCSAYLMVELDKYNANKVIQFNHISPIIRDDNKRYNVGKFHISWTNIYHIISTYVEVNITDKGSIEHSMIGICSDSFLSSLIWSQIDKVFNTTVKSYFQYKIQTLVLCDKVT